MSQSSSPLWPNQPMISKGSSGWLNAFNICYEMCEERKGKRSSHFTRPWYLSSFQQIKLTGNSLALPWRWVEVKSFFSRASSLSLHHHTIAASLPYILSRFPPWSMGGIWYTACQRQKSQPMICHNVRRHAPTAAQPRSEASWNHISMIKRWSRDLPKSQNSLCGRPKPRVLAGPCLLHPTSSELVER